MAGDASLMLMLLRAGVPNAELLLANDRADLLKIASRHNVDVPDSSSMPPQVMEVAPPPDSAGPPIDPYNVAGSPALSRARAWRYQYIVDGTSPGSPPKAEGTSDVMAAEAPAAQVTVAVAAASAAATAAVSAGAATSPDQAPPSSPSSMVVEGSYEGQFNEFGQREGVGSCTFSNGSVYAGEWRADVQEGRGKVRYPDGSVFVGSFRHGMKEGSGTYGYDDGRVEVARYKRGVNDRGEGAMWSPRRHSAWRILRDGEEVEEISVEEARVVAERVGEDVPERNWLEANL